MIDVIIPAYNSHDTLEQTLFSICVQDIVKKINVYICNDHSDEDYSKIVDKFNQFLNITELVLSENSGPGVARQYGLDHSYGEFVVFIDSDDQFYAPDSLKKLYDVIVRDKSDMVIGGFLEELNDCVIPHFNDRIWLHGKMYRRDFLLKHHIRFNDTSANEDNYFNKSLLIRSVKFSVLDEIVYFWRMNLNSITRKNNYEYFYKGIYGYLYNMTQVLKEAIQDDVLSEKIKEYAVEFMITTYFYYLEFFDREDSFDLITSSSDIYDIFISYRYVGQELEDECFKLQFDFFRNSLTESKILRPVVTFDEFLALYKK